jgi:hypothetical protein
MQKDVPTLHEVVVEISRMFNRNNFKNTCSNVIIILLNHSEIFQSFDDSY